MLVPDNNFQSVVSSPEQFGLSAEEIETACSECGASAGTEGPARDAIMRMAAEHGWIRIRTFRQADTRVVVQGHNVDSQITSLQDLVSQLREKSVITDTATVVISDYATGESRSFRVGESGVAEDIDGDLEQS